MAGGGDVDMGNGYPNGGMNGGLAQYMDEEEEGRTVNLFLEAISRIEELEKMKSALDDRESKLKANLRVKYDEERATTKIASDLLFEKESLRDELIRLKDAREKLIDELQVLKSVDEEMSAFNNLNEQFNENLRKHLALIEEKQTKIYTLKPIITGTHVACEADFAGKDKAEMHRHLQQVIKDNINHVNEEIKKTCDEHFIRSTEEWNALATTEKTSKAKIRTLKNKIKAKQTGKGKGSKDDDETSESSFSSKKSGQKRTASSDNDFVCEACHKSFNDQESFAYHCFRGCSQLEDLLRDRGEDVTLDCRECGETITSFMSFHDHLKRKHGYGSPEDAKAGNKKSSLGSSSVSKRRK